MKWPRFLKLFGKKVEKTENARASEFDRLLAIAKGLQINLDCVPNTAILSVIDLNKLKPIEPLAEYSPAYVVGGIKIRASWAVPEGSVAFFQNDKFLGMMKL